MLSTNVCYSLAAINAWMLADLPDLGSWYKAVVKSSVLKDAKIDVPLVYNTDGSLIHPGKYHKTIEDGALAVIHGILKVWVLFANMFFEQSHEIYIATTSMGTAGVKGPGHIKLLFKKCSFYHCQISRRARFLLWRNGVPAMTTTCSPGMLLLVPAPQHKRRERLGYGFSLVVLFAHWNVTPYRLIDLDLVTTREFYILLSDLADIKWSIKIELWGVGDLARARAATIE